MDVELARLTLVKKDNKLAWLGSLMKLAKKASSSWLVSGSSQLVWLMSHAHSGECSKRKSKITNSISWYDWIRSTDKFERKS